MLRRSPRAHLDGRDARLRRQSARSARRAAASRRGASRRCLHRRQSSNVMSCCSRCVRTRDSNPRPLPLASSIICLCLCRPLRDVRSNPTLADSNSFLHVEAPPHKEALLLTAKSDELSMRAIFSSFEHTKLILSLATNSLVNVCDEVSGQACTGSRRGGEQMRLLRMPRRTARWDVERVE